MARPRLKAADKRTFAARVWLKRREREKLRDAASKEGLSLGTWARRVLLKAARKESV